MDGEANRATERCAIQALGYQEQGFFLIVVGIGCFALPFVGIIGFGLTGFVVNTLGLGFSVLGRAAEVVILMVCAIPIVYGSVVLVEAARHQASILRIWRWLYGLASIALGVAAFVQGFLVEELERVVETYINAVMVWSLISGVSDLGDATDSSLSRQARLLLTLSALLSLGFGAVLVHFGPHVDLPHEAFAMLSACASYAIALGHAKLGVRNALLRVSP